MCGLAKYFILHEFCYEKTKMCYTDIGPTVFVNFFTGTSNKQGC